MLRRFVSFFLVFILLLIINSQAYAKQNLKSTKTFDDKISKGTWLWDTNKIVNEGKEIVKFMKNNKFNELYLQINTDIKEDIYSEFIENAYKNGIKVYALDGNPKWVFEDKREGLNNFFDWVKDYNKNVSQTQKFVGIHLDVEPYTLPEWNTKKDILVKNYKNYIDYSLNKSREMNLNLAVDIPFWFDEVNFDKENLAEWVISKVDGINIMAYRDKIYGEGNIIDICKNEVEFSKKYNKKLIISVETGDTKEGDFVTFYQEGREYMMNELNKLSTYYENSGVNFGLAIHCLDWLR